MKNNENKLKNILNLINNGKLDLEKGSKIVKNTEFDLEIDYRKSFQEMINDGSYCNTENLMPIIYYPSEFLNKKVQVTARLLKFKHNYFNDFKKGGSVDEIIEEIYRIGYRPANIFELLSLGANFFELNPHFWLILALGSVFSNTDKVCSYSYLVYAIDFRNGGKRHLELAMLGRHSGGYNYLVVRK